MHTDVVCFLFHKTVHNNADCTMITVFYPFRTRCFVIVVTVGRSGRLFLLFFPCLRRHNVHIRHSLLYVPILCIKTHACVCICGDAYKSCECGVCSSIRRGCVVLKLWSHGVNSGSRQWWNTSCFSEPSGFFSGGGDFPLVF